MNKSGTLMVHLDLIRDGHTQSSPLTTFGIGVAPEHDSEEWGRLGLITVGSELPVLGQSIDIIAPKENGGTLELKNRIHLGPVSREFVLTAVDYTEFSTELAAMAGPINDSATVEGALTQYTPFGGDSDPILGWWRLRWIDERDVLQRREVIWGELRLAQALAAGMAGPIAPQFKLTNFVNALNTGALRKSTT